MEYGASKATEYRENRVREKVIFHIFSQFMQIYPKTA